MPLIASKTCHSLHICVTKSRAYCTIKQKHTLRLCDLLYLCCRLVHLDSCVVFVFLICSWYLVPRVYFYGHWADGIANSKLISVMYVAIWGSPGMHLDQRGIFLEVRAKLRPPPVGYEFHIDCFICLCAHILEKRNTVRWYNFITPRGISWNNDRSWTFRLSWVRPNPVLGTAYALDTIYMDKVFRERNWSEI